MASTGARGSMCFRWRLAARVFGASSFDSRRLGRCKVHNAVRFAPRATRMKLSNGVAGVSFDVDSLLGAHMVTDSDRPKTPISTLKASTSSSRLRSIGAFSARASSLRSTSTNR